MFASMSSAAVKIGVYAPIGIESCTPITDTAWYTHPALIITPGNVKDVDYDIFVGYSSVGNGEDIDADTSLILGATWWTGQAGPITYGPSIFYYSQGVIEFMNGGAYGGGSESKASDNTMTSTNLVFSMKTAILPSLDLRADILVLSSVGGKAAGNDIKSFNEMFNTIQLGIAYNFQL